MGGVGLAAGGNVRPASAAGSYVDLSSDQVVGGVKTFSESPIAPEPTKAEHVATRAFVLANTGVTADAAAGVKGILQLAGDLGGTAAAPTVPGLAERVLRTNTEPVVGRSTLLQSISADRSSYRERIALSSFARPTQPSGFYTDAVWAFGYNMTAAHTKEINSEPMFRIAMEASWWDGTDTHSELHLGAYIDPSSPTPNNELRPVSVEVMHGGEGGLGRPGVSFTVSERHPAPFVVHSVSGGELMNFGSGNWYLRRNVNVHRGPSAPSLLTIGDALNSTSLVFNAKAVGGVNSLEFQRGGTPKWLLYDAGSNVLYLRNMQNARMQVTFIPGPNAATSFADLDCTIRCSGLRNVFGPATNQVGLGSFGTSDAWIGAEGSNTSIALNLQSKGSSPIVSKSAHRFEGSIGFYGAGPVAKPIGVPVTAAGIHAALVTLGLIAA